MKGVIMQIAPDAVIVDVTHEIKRQNILHGAFVLQQTMRWYPPGSIHVIVVDPGVGTPRQIIAAKYDNQFVVAPDNGLISFVHHKMRLEAIRVVENPKFALASISSTFHGRDIMAPTAAHLANGENIINVGPSAERVEVLQFGDAAKMTPQGVAGGIIHIDGFGNIITTISHADALSFMRAKPTAEVYIDNTRIGPVRNTYGDVPEGTAIAVLGSSDLLEISINGGNAREQFQPTAKTVIEIR